MDKMAKKVNRCLGIGAMDIFWVIMRNYMMHEIENSVRVSKRDKLEVFSEFVDDILMIRSIQSEACETTTRRKQMRRFI